MNGLDLLFLVWLGFLTVLFIGLDRQLHVAMTKVGELIQKLTAAMSEMADLAGVPQLDELDVFESEAPERPPVGKAW